MSEQSELMQAVIDGERAEVISLVNDALENGADAQTLLTDHMIPGMMKVGEYMEEGEYYIPEVLLSAKSMKAGMEILEPLLAAGQHKYVGKFIIGTVAGDIHDIGKNLVVVLLKGNGFEVKDLGTSVPTEQFIEAVKETEEPVVLGMSALITPVLDEMENVINAVNEAGLRERTKILVGGAPVTEEFAESIGADGTAADAASTVKIALKLLNA